MMKKLILISALLFSFNGQAEYSLVLDCKVTEQLLLRIKDGKPLMPLPGWPGGYKKGEKQILLITAKQENDSLKVITSIGDYHQRVIRQSSVSLLYNGSRLEMRSNENINNWLRVDKKYIGYHINSADLKLHKYSNDGVEKGKWNGSLLDNSGTYTHYTAYDCLNILNQAAISNFIGNVNSLK